jgi:hypothetical protein
METLSLENAMPAIASWEVTSLALGVGTIHLLGWICRGRHMCSVATSGSADVITADRNGSREHNGYHQLMARV